MPTNSTPFFAYGDGKVQTDFEFTDQYGRGVLLQADGRIVVAGTNFLVRYHADGSLDTAFGTAGRVVAPFASSYGLGQVAALQADGKILFAGTRWNAGVPSYAVARYLADGTLDTGFGTAGIATVSFGSSGDDCAAVTLLADGKILLAGTTMAAGFYDYGLALLDADGAPVSTFGSGGQVITDFGIAGDQARALAVQADGKILVTGWSHADPGFASTDFSLARYNADGSLDGGFGTGGKLTADIAAADSGSAVAVQPDGKIVVVGTSSGDIVVLRYNADGTPDTGFDADGKAVVSLLPYDSGTCVALQPDGKILVGGQAADAGSSRFALLRFNADGTLDDGFGTGGIVQTAFGSGFYAGDSTAYGIAVQPDGKIVLSGTAFSGGTRDIGLARYNRDGSLDLSFDSVKTDPLAVTAHVGEDRAPVALDPGARARDAELAAAGHYGGATLTLTRLGGANADDRFSASGALGPLAEGAPLTLGGIAIGAVTTNSGGTLVLAFDSGATQARLDQAMQSIAYTNLGEDPPGSLDIAWTFDDGNAGAQGSGGAGSVTGTSHVTVTLLDKAPQLPGVDADAAFTENGAPVVLDSSVQALDPELSAAGTYAGASIALARHGGADANDRFSASGNLAALNPGALVLGGVTIGTVDANAGGILKLTFGSNATQARVDEALSSIAYAYAGDTPPASALIDWTFNDGNTGAQGAGGAKSTQAQTLVHLTAANDAPAWSGVAASAVYSYGSAAMALDTSVHVVDAELAARGHYGGATVSLARHGGADPRDGFFARGNLDSLAEGGNLTLSGGTVGTVVRNSGGSLELLFDDQATQAVVDEVLSSIAYASTGILPPASVQLDWTFNDGNTGDQGGGGALSATASTVVDIVPANTAPEFDDVRADPLEVAEGGVAALDPGISVLDTDLAAIGNYAGSTLTLRRHGGADAEDQFVATGGLGALLAGGPLYLGGATVGTVLANGGGSLVLGFNAAATQTVIDEVLRSIGYRFAGFAAPGTLQIDWNFDDGNTGAQGGDGAKSATAATSVHVIPVNGAPDLSGVTSTVVFDVDDKPVVVAPALHVYDPELSAANDFSGASITLQRQLSANPEDRFGSTGNLAGLAEGGNLLLSGISVGTVTHNSNGLLTLTFNGGATQARVDEVLRSITYANTNNGPPGWVSLQWQFSDGNTGAQGSGGVLTAQTTTGVEIPPLPNRFPNTALSVNSG
ncbi:MAG TPA: hypothetical protein PKD29_10895, partial [Rhodocyclaceae bacterium]|nr:hypothetical protein [Rhodocyclaceae bacterium]